MAFSALSATVRVSVNWNATNNLVGTSLQPISNNTTLSKSLALGTKAANSALGGADTLVSFIVGGASKIAASGNATVNLFGALTDVLNDTSVTLVRLKTLVIQLLSTTDDATYGTNCSGVTIGITGTNDWSGIWTVGTPNETSFTVDNGGIVLFARGNSGGATVGSTSTAFKITNNDATNAAAVQITVIGGSN